MILEGNQRGGARDLAQHLLKSENEHVHVHELRGFIADDLTGALDEARAMSKATKAKQFLYSLSLNPPIDAKVTTEQFEDAISRVENKLGLEHQPRAVVFHEKQGRRHCHVVWSRTDLNTMTAVHLPYTKRKLMELSRDLYIEHGWDMPKGMMNPEYGDPRNFTLSQWQQAKRQGKDPRTIKQALQDSWAISDNAKSFANALKERGYTLAKGDRRGFVVVDHKCEVYAVAKWVGIKTKEVRAKLGKESDLPSVSAVKVTIAKEMEGKLSDLHNQQQQTIDHRIDQVNQLRNMMTEQHQQDRTVLEQQQEQRWEEELRARQGRFRKGLRGLLDRFTGKRKRIAIQNEQQTKACQQRDMQERDALAFQHLEARQNTQKRLIRLQKLRQERAQAVQQDIAQYHEIAKNKRQSFEPRM